MIYLLPLRSQIIPQVRQVLIDILDASVVVWASGNQMDEPKSFVK